MNQLIQDLQNPDALPDPTKHVKVAQTHISVVFIADAFVYKIKKPVNFGFLDFSSLDKRRHYCHQEVELNRRLAADLYVGVMPVYRVNGRYVLAEKPLKEAPIEYAVKMKRIPDESLMKSLFQEKRVTNEQLSEIAGVLSEFHQRAEFSPEISTYAEPDRFRVNTDENFEQVQGLVDVTISAQQFSDIQKWTNAFYKENDDLFWKRIQDGRIRDCHGDLHMEHICLMEGLPIIDCIEFNDRFRYSDALADIAFLLMDLEYHDGWNEAQSLWSEYRKLSHETDVDHLLRFYKVYRAFVRGKVNGFQVGDSAISETDQQAAIERAKSYFDLAHHYVMS